MLISDNILDEFYIGIKKRYSALPMGELFYWLSLAVEIASNYKIEPEKLMFDWCKREDGYYNASCFCCVVLCGFQGRRMAFQR